MKLFSSLYDKENRKIFITTITTSLIVHFQLYALMITGPDTLIDSMYHQADVWELMLFRFGLYFMQAIKGNIVVPFFSTLISSIFLAITVILVIKIFKLKNKYFKYIISILFAVSPNISATLTFFYCSDAYILGLLLATLAIYIMKRYESKKWPIFFSGLLVSLSMGMYETYLSVTMVLCVATLMIDVLKKKELKQIFINLLKYILMGSLGVVLFYAISHIVLLITKLPASNYSGADSIGIASVASNFLTLLPEAYESFFNYYFNDKMIPNTIWYTNILYIIIFAISLSSIIYIVIKDKIYKKPTNIVLILILIVIAPICFGVIEIAVPKVDIHILMACSMIYIFPIFFKILEMLPKDKISRIFKYTVMICSLFVIWNYIWQDNASYISIKTMQNQAVNTASRLVTHIEEIDEYNPDMPVLILGGLENNRYLNRYNTSIEAKKVFDRSWGFISDKSTIWWGNLDSWRKIFYEYLGTNIKLIGERECEDILQSKEFKNMKYYPEKDGIKVINNIIVIKLSDW